MDERPTRLYEVYARDKLTERIIMQPHEVLAKNQLEAILKAQKFFGLFVDIRQVRIDVDEIAVLSV
jgi:hypothetical protein